MRSGVKEMLDGVSWLSRVSLPSGQKGVLFALPDATLKALGTCRLTEWDLAVPVQRGTDIRLVRRYNSFFHPRAEFGVGWTMDLPYLVPQPIPDRRTVKCDGISGLLPAPWHR